MSVAILFLLLLFVFPSSHLRFQSVIHSTTLSCHQVSKSLHSPDIHFQIYHATYLALGLKIKGFLWVHFSFYNVIVQHVNVLSLSLCQGWQGFTRPECWVIKDTWQHIRQQIQLLGEKLNWTQKNNSRFKILEKVFMITNSLKLG